MTKEDILVLNQRNIPLKTRRSLRARRLRLEAVPEKQEIHLVVPRFAMSFEVNRFLSDRLTWIEEQWDKMKKQCSIHPKPQYKTGDVFYYFGEPVVLSVRLHEKKNGHQFGYAMTK